MTVVPSRASVLPDLVEEVVATPMVPPALLRSLAVQRQALLRLGQTAHVRTLEVLDLTDGGDIRIVRSASTLPSVGEVVRTSGALPWRDATLVVVQAAQALRDAHHLGLAHPSLSPDRLLITGPGEVRLDGFGVLAEIDVCLGHPHDPLATPVPEAERRRPVLTTDSFALASLFVTLVTAAPTDPGHLDGALADVPLDLADTLRLALSGEPGERPRPGVLAATLAEWATDDRPAPAPTAAPRPARPAPAPTATPLAVPMAIAPLDEVTAPAILGPGGPRRTSSRPKMPWSKVGLGVLAAIIAVAAGRVMSGDPSTGIGPSPATTVAADAAAPVDTPVVPVETTVPAPVAPVPVVAPVAVVPETTAAPTPEPEVVATTVAPVATRAPTTTRRQPITTTTAAPVDEVDEPAPTATTVSAPTGPMTEREEPAYDGPAPGSVGGGSAD